MTNQLTILRRTATLDNERAAEYLRHSRRAGSLWAAAGELLDAGMWTPVLEWCEREVERLWCGECDETGVVDDTFTIIAVDGPMLTFDHGPPGGMGRMLRPTFTDSVRVGDATMTVSDSSGFRPGQTVSCRRKCACGRPPRPTNEMCNMVERMRGSLETPEPWLKALRLWWPAGWFEWLKANGGQSGYMDGKRWVRIKDGDSFVIIWQDGSLSDWWGILPPLPIVPECVCIEAGVERGRCPDPCLKSWFVPGHVPQPDGTTRRCHTCRGTDLCPRCGTILIIDDPVRDVAIDQEAHEWAERILQNRAQVMGVYALPHHPGDDT